MPLISDATFINFDEKTLRIRQKVKTHQHQKIQTFVTEKKTQIYEDALLSQLMLKLKKKFL